MLADASHATLNGVTRRYPGAPPLHALGPIDLTLMRGEFFSVVGPSGCGKSTLLDVLAGLNAPTEGPSPAPSPKASAWCSRRMRASPG
jgi:NitT/TauT family transport system ATP-binding protein